LDEAAVCYWRNLHLSWLVRQGLDEAENLWQLVIHPFAQEIQVWMKPKTCGNLSFIRLARNNRVWMKPQTCGNKSFIYSDNFL
jgi:hypothetical protein